MKTKGRLPRAAGEQPELPITWRTFLIGLLLATALGGALRFVNLGGASAWIDEIYTIRDVPIALRGDHHLSKTIGYIPTAVGLALGGVDVMALDRTPEGWSAQGVTMFKARWPNALLGVLTIPIMGLLLRPTIGMLPALLAAVVVAVSPWHLWMSQLARFYSMQFLFATICLALYLLWIRDRRTRDLILSMLALAAAFFTQPPAIVLGGGFAVAWIVDRLRRERDTRATATLVAGIITAGICLAAMAIDVLRRPEQWVKFAGDQPSQSPMVLLLALPWLAVPSLTLAAGAAMFMCFRWSPRQATVLIACALVPTAAGVAGAFEGSMHVRYLFVLLAPTAVLGALAISRWMGSAHAARLGRIGVVMVPVVILMPLLVTSVTYHGPGLAYRAAFKEAFEFVGTRAEPGDEVVADLNAATIGSFYEGRPIRDVRTLDRDSLPAGTIWIVAHAASPSWRRGKEPLSPIGGADFIALIENRVFQPHHAVAVWKVEVPQPSETAP